MGTPLPIFSRGLDVLSERRAVVVDGDTYHKSDWMDGGRDPGLSPTVFLVEQAPNVSLRTHFHRNNQFQVFVRGGGSIGPHPLRALTVHYAGAFTGYGPLQAGPEGLAYFTIRTVFETGSLTMHSDREQMMRGPKRQLHSAPVDLLDPSRLAVASVSTVDTLIAPEADPAGAWLHTVAPGAPLQMPDPAPDSAGAFLLVVAGAVVGDGRRLDRWQSAFVGVGARLPPLHAAPEGAQALVLQMPVKAAAYAGRGLVSGTVPPAAG